MIDDRKNQPHHVAEMIASVEHQLGRRTQNGERRRHEQDSGADFVQEASEESFPAGEAPAWIPLAAIGHPAAKAGGAGQTFGRETAMFRNREDVARQLAEKLKKRELHDPLVLAIPRGGVVTGAVLARELGAELDVVLSRKLQAPGQPELAIGAISEDGRVYLNHYAQAYLNLLEDHLAQERGHQLREIARRKKLFRAVRPKASVAGHSVIVTDDGIATGSTMIAALQAIKAQNPHEVIVAVPVASPDRLAEVGRWCDEVVCLLAPEAFYAIGQFYEDFTQVEDEEVLDLLRQALPAARTEEVLRK
jgi:predicted phosphoribosyltransferase